MVNQQKGVQQETAYSAVVVNGIPVPVYIILSCFYDPFWDKKEKHFLGGMSSDPPRGMGRYCAHH